MILPSAHTPSVPWHDTCSYWHKSVSADRAVAAAQLFGALGGGSGGPFSATLNQTVPTWSLWP